jgi:hypothetical protein
MKGLCRADKHIECVCDFCGDVSYIQKHFAKN